MLEQSRIKKEFRNWIKGYSIENPVFDVKEVTDVELDEEGWMVTLYGEIEKCYFSYLGDGKFEFEGSKE